jgi:hypothetical protein
MHKSKPILVTGAHRSGTTLVGKMIAHSPLVHYIHEPFNIDYSPCKIKAAYWFQYITRENETPMYQQIEQLVNPSPSPAAPPKSKSISQLLNFFKPLIGQQRVLIKDPIAVFSVEWLVQRFNMDAVVLIRHPAAFADSIRERNWTHNFTHFLNQPLLMEEHFGIFKEEILKFTRKEYDIIDQAILLWKLIYYMVSKYREKHPEWFYIKHEDLSLDPLKGFKEIFGYLKIGLSKEIKKIIREHSNYTNLIDGDIHSIKRNSKVIIKKWKNKFTGKEIKKIRDSVEHISRKFYSDEEW